MRYRAFCILFTFAILVTSGHSHNYSLTGSGNYAPAALVLDNGAGSPTLHRRGLICDYDYVIREVAAQQDQDWRLLAAIAYNESRFQPSVVSPQGASGLMQIMPRTARHFDVDPARIMDPHTNVTIAAKLLARIEGMLRIPRGVSYDDRMSLVLASYNGGIGHVADARRLAEKYGADPNAWSDVSQYLTMKSDPQYLEDEAVQCGTFSGQETLAFVKGVMGKYHAYCRKCPA